MKAVKSALVLGLVLLGMDALADKVAQTPVRRTAGLSSHPLPNSVGPISPVRPIPIPVPKPLPNFVPVQPSPVKLPILPKPVSNAIPGKPGRF